jgi:hypothetical protein
MSSSSTSAASTEANQNKRPRGELVDSSDEPRAERKNGTLIYLKPDRDTRKTLMQIANSLGIRNSIMMREDDLRCVVFSDSDLVMPLKEIESSFFFKCNVAGITVIPHVNGKLALAVDVTSSSIRRLRPLLRLQGFNIPPEADDNYSYQILICNNWSGSLPRDFSASAEIAWERLVVTHDVARQE